MTPVEGSDLDKGVRPLSRGRKGVLHIAIHRSSALRALTCAYLTRIPQLGSFFGEGAIAYRTSRTPALMHPPGCYSDSPRSRLAEPKTGGKGVGFYQSTLVVALG